MNVAEPTKLDQAIKDLVKDQGWSGNIADNEASQTQSGS
jgi:hypothetical protein